MNKVKTRKVTPKGTHTRVIPNKKKEQKKTGEALPNSIMKYLAF